MNNSIIKLHEISKYCTKKLYFLFLSILSDNKIIWDAHRKLKPLRFYYNWHFPKTSILSLWFAPWLVKSLRINYCSGLCPWKWSSACKSRLGQALINIWLTLVHLHTPYMYHWPSLPYFNDIHRSILPIDVMYQCAAFKPLYHIQFSLPQLH